MCSPGIGKIRHFNYVLGQGLGNLAKRSVVRFSQARNISPKRLWIPYLSHFGITRNYRVCDSRDFH